MKYTLTFKKYVDTDKILWEKINKESNATFITSTNWIEFQKILGKKIDQYLIYLKNAEVDVLIGNCYIEIFQRKIANFAYSPYGPVINWNFLFEILKTGPIKIYSEIFKEIKNFQQRYINETQVNLYRFDPLISKEFLKVFSKLGYKKSNAPAQAKDIWEIDITKNEEILLKEMKKVARYNIKKSEEAGIKIVKINDRELLKEFSDILMATTKRHNFSSYDEKYFLNQFDNLNKVGMCDIFLAKYKEKYISGALINSYNKIGYYSHGGSLQDQVLQKYGASYLLHWEIIKYLKTKDFKKYNMWGILPESLNPKIKQRLPLQGVSDFKKRFGGYEKNYIGPLETYTNILKYSFQSFYDLYTYKNDRY